MKTSSVSETTPCGIQVAEKQANDVEASHLSQEVPVRWRGWKCCRTATLTVCALLAFYGLAHARNKHHRHHHHHHDHDHELPMHYECLFAVGGGLVGHQGGFPQDSRLMQFKCAVALDHYIEGGQYNKDIKEAVEQARAYFFDSPAWRDRVADPSNHAVVFDIDETTLSNIGHLRAYFAGDSKDAPHVLTRSADDILASKNVPAIEPMLQLYKDLYEAGFTVTFVTGRAEGGRNATIANLAHAGYGGQCSSQQLLLRGEKRRASEACWLDLDMRSEDDVHKVASVYKPERRARLLDKGYEIVGNIGDQWSDLAGENVATASFKVPNPMYYIL